MTASVATTLNDSALTIARALFRTGVRPLGTARVSSFFREGLPEAFRAPVDFLFTRELSANDVELQARVEAMRAEIENSNKLFHVISNRGTVVEASSGHIASKSSTSPEWGMFLHLCADSFRAQAILELGSCIGISGSYLASVSTCQEFIGVEASDDLFGIANENVKKVQPAATVVHGSADDMLPEICTKFQNGIDLAFIDANHNFEPTLRYMKLIALYLKPSALVIFDDIHWYKPLWEAWCVLRTQEGFSCTLDVGRFGLGVWQGGTQRPKNFELAFYTGWLRKYNARRT